jgi:hypothetical protein
MSALQDHFSAFAEQLNLPRGLDKNGVLRLMLDNEVTVTFEVPPDETVICFYSEIMMMNNEIKNDFYQKLLGLNFFNLPHIPTWIALDTNSHNLMLAGATPAIAITAELLACIVEQIADEVLNLRNSFALKTNLPNAETDNLMQHAIRG